MEEEQIRAELDLQRSKLLERLAEAKKAVSHSQKTLQDAISNFNDEHEKARAKGAFVPSSEHAKQCSDIALAGQALTTSLNTVYEAVDELQAQFPTR